MENNLEPFEFTVEIYGLCVINQGSSGGFHNVIAVKHAKHQLFIVVHERHLDRDKTDSVLLDEHHSYKEHQHTYFHFRRHTQIEITKTNKELSENRHDRKLNPAALRYLGLGPLKDGVVGTDRSTWSSGVLGRVLLPVDNSSSGWRDPLGLYQFEENGKVVHIADMFFWGGQYRKIDDLWITVHLERGKSTRQLYFQNIYNEDFSVGIGCVAMNERLRSGSAKPFGYIKSFEQVAEGRIRKYKPRRVMKEKPYFPEHMGSSSCPPTTG